MQFLQHADRFQRVVGAREGCPAGIEDARHLLENHALGQLLGPGVDFGFQVEAMGTAIPEELQDFDLAFLDIDRLGGADDQIVLAGFRGQGG
jgi:hypothetical protein